MQRSFEELTPQNFSFNSPLGWCAACEGLGTEIGTNQNVIVANPNLTLRDGAVSAWPRPKETPAFLAFLEAFGNHFEIDIDRPWYQLTPHQQRLVLQGTGDRFFSVKFPDGRSCQFQYKGIYPAIEEASRVSYDYRMKLQDLVGERPCSVCQGQRIRDDAAAVRLADQTLPHLCQLPLEEVLEFLSQLKLDADQKKVAGDLLNEVTSRLKFLIDVGLHYLTLDRGMPTLSGGESQRIRLAGQIGRALTGVLYVLDEPTIGLHPRDNGRLIQALAKLRDLGNTVVLVEHDREVLESADRLYDFGPGSGRFGGTVTAEGTPKQIARQSKASLTGAYLSGRQGIPVPLNRRLKLKKGAAAPTDALTAHEAYATPPGGDWLELTGCRQHNLHDVDLRIPLGTLTCITGLSGSGKSSLIQETLAPAVARHLRRQGPPPGPFDRLLGAASLRRVITVDQQSLGATPASNPATYTGVFDPIRDLFTKLPDSKIRGFKAGRFSFNRAGGRCEDCEGMGQKKIEMHFLPDVWVECDTCHGRRYNQETLSVTYRGNSIADVLEMSISQALELFQNIPKIRAPLATLEAIGLGYLTLGQSATTLSGGEAQRVKLAAELAKPNAGSTLYLLDEPTTGLHFDDIAKLLKVLNSLVEQGNTVVIIEHNLDVIKTADWIVDLGPEAGVAGGWIVAAGTPEDVVAQAEKLSGTGTKNKRRTKRKPAKTTKRQNNSPSMRSWTGELLASVLAEDPRGEIDVFDVDEAAKKRKGDITIASVGKEVSSPWQVDGRAWHTRNRISRAGTECRWEGAALEYVVDLLADFKELKPANWNDQAHVEVTAKKKSGTGWLFHALTGDEWLLRLYFRVPKGTFQEAQLQRQIALKPVNDLDELPIYNRSDRVRCNNKKGPFQEVVLDIHWKEEIDTPEFREFLTTTVNAYLGRVNRSGSSMEELTPWKVLGKKWHLSRKGFPSNKRVSWNLDVLDTLFTVLETQLPDLEADWSNKTQVTYRAQGSPHVLAELQTKRRDAIHLTLFATTGQFSLGQVADIGHARDIVLAKKNQEALRLQFVTANQVNSDALAEFLAAFATQNTPAG